jgi:hypothetical protein
MPWLNAAESITLLANDPHKSEAPNMATESYVTSALPGYNVSIHEIHARIDRLTKILRTSDCILTRQVQKDAASVDSMLILVYESDSGNLSLSYLNFYPWDPLYVIKRQLLQSISPELWPFLYFTYQEILSHSVDDEAPIISRHRHHCSSLHESNTLSSIFKIYQSVLGKTVTNCLKPFPVVFSLSLGLEIWVRDFYPFINTTNYLDSFTIASSNDGRVVCKKLLHKLYVPVSSTVEYVFTVLCEAKVLSGFMEQVKWLRVSKREFLTYISNPHLEHISSQMLERHLTTAFPSSIELTSSDLLQNFDAYCNDEYILLADMCQSNRFSPCDSGNVAIEGCDYFPISVLHASHDQATILVTEEASLSELKKRCEDIISLAFPFSNNPDILMSTQSGLDRCLTSISIRAFCSEFHQFTSPSLYTEYPSIIVDIIRVADSKPLNVLNTTALKYGDVFQIFPYLFPSDNDKSSWKETTCDPAIAEVASTSDYPESDAVLPKRKPSFFPHLKFSNSFILEILEYFWSLNILPRKEIHLFPYDKLFRYVCQMRNALSLIHFCLKNKLLVGHRKYSSQDPSQFAQPKLLSRLNFPLNDVISIEDSDSAEDVSSDQKHISLPNLPKRRRIARDYVQIEGGIPFDFPIKKEYIEID